MAKALSRVKKSSAKAKSSVKRAASSPARKKVGKAPPRPAPKKPAAKAKAAKGSAKTLNKTLNKTLKSSPAKRAANTKTAAKAGKWVYLFGDGKAEGKAGMRELLGGKGANLAEMTNLGLPVPPGFTITTEACRTYLANGFEPAGLSDEIATHLADLERTMGRRLGDAANPLLVSVRSGAKFSMPGMMETVLNVGLSDASVAGLARHVRRTVAIDPCGARTARTLCHGAGEPAAQSPQCDARRRRQRNIDRRRRDHPCRYAAEPAGTGAARLAFHPASRRSRQIEHFQTKACPRT